MADNIDYAAHIVSGLTTHCYSHVSAQGSTRPVIVCFLTHMRIGSYKQVESVAHALVNQVQGKCDYDIYVVSFDHRNHGERLLNPETNKSWAEGNKTHAHDMYSMVYGCAQDLTMLIDFLPHYLFPEGRTIHRWNIVGISMGGHAAWVALAKEPRLSLACVIVGTPAYVKLVTDRAISSGIPLEPPYFPVGFLKTMERTYAGAVPYASHRPENPFLGKRIFAQSGGIDTLVPWSASAEFFDKLVVGERQGGTKESKIYPNAAHECTDEMVTDAAHFITASAGVKTVDVTTSSDEPGAVGPASHR